MSELPNQRSPGPPIVRSIIRPRKTARDESQKHRDKGNAQADTIRDSNVDLTALVYVRFLIRDLRRRGFGHVNIDGVWDAESWRILSTNVICVKAAREMAQNHSVLTHSA